MQTALKILIFCGFAAACCACSDESRPPLEYPVPEAPGELATEPYDWEKSRTEIPASTDMVLLYGGGHHRSPYLWTKQRMADYVTYTDPDGATRWLFDSFLFLEIMDPGPEGAGKKFANGYTYAGKQLESAAQSDWQMLIDYLFQSETGLGALESSIAEAADRLGEPARKRQVVVSIPEPIVYRTIEKLSTVYWGRVDGKELDFSKSADRARACQWFIDRVRAGFDRKGYRYIELAGFYWLAEKSTDTGSILATVGKYLDRLNYGFNWIPYFNAEGFARWKSYGFHYAYLQPNYFFSESVPESRLDEACGQALANDMQMELEFDDNALSGRGKADRLRDYMSAFKRHGIWERKRLAYYQGSSSLQLLKNSANAADRDLYHEFCRFVVSRPIRSGE